MVLVGREGTLIPVGDREGEVLTTTPSSLIMQRAPCCATADSAGQHPVCEPKSGLQFKTIFLLISCRLAAVLEDQCQVSTLLYKDSRPPRYFIFSDGFQNLD